MHNFDWALNEWRNGRSAVRKRWDNTAECYVEKDSGRLISISRLGVQVRMMRHLDFDDISSIDWMSGDSNSIPLQTSEHVAV